MSSCTMVETVKRDGSLSIESCQAYRVARQRCLGSSMSIDRIANEHSRTLLEHSLPDCGSELVRLLPLSPAFLRTSTCLRLSKMGFEGQPFIYDRPNSWNFAGPTDRGFNPKAATQASWTQKPTTPKKDGPLIDFNKHPDSVCSSFCLDGYH